MKKLTFSQLEDMLYQRNEKNQAPIDGYIVFSQDSFDEPFTEQERTYRVSQKCKRFMPRMFSNSIFGDCLDGKDLGVRLDWYISPESKHPWQIEYCYVD